MCHIWGNEEDECRHRNHPKQAAFSISLILITFSSKNGYVQFE